MSRTNQQGLLAQLREGDVAGLPVPSAGGAAASAAAGWDSPGFGTPPQQQQDHHHHHHHPGRGRDADGPAPSTAATLYCTPEGAGAPATPVGEWYSILRTIDAAGMGAGVHGAMAKQPLVCQEVHAQRERWQPP
jgi:hypothetical protein